MLVIRVELWSAVTHRVTEIARMQIANVGGTLESGNYEGIVFRGDNREDLDKSMQERDVASLGYVSHYPRRTAPVWSLVTKMLTKMGYGQEPEAAPLTAPKTDL